MISWDRVNELREEVGKDDFIEVVELFLDEVETTLARLRDEADPNRYAEDLHFLKGSALTLGFRALSALCLERERRLARDPDEMPDPAELLQIYEQSKAEFLTTAIGPSRH